MLHIGALPVRRSEARVQSMTMTVNVPDEYLPFLVRALEHYHGYAVATPTGGPPLFASR